MDFNEQKKVFPRAFAEKYIVISYQLFKARKEEIGRKKKSSQKIALFILLFSLLHAAASSDAFVLIYFQRLFSSFYF